MPLLHYFTFVGGALLALQLIVSWLFPKMETTDRSNVARPLIRIASERVWPPRVDIDTRVHAAVLPSSVPDIAQQAPARAAEAQPGEHPPSVAVLVRTERKKARVAKRPTRLRMAANRQGFQPFHSSWWPL